MKGTPAVYLGRIIDKKHFRAFVHGVNGEKKLVESWEAFEAAMQSGLWFARIEDVNEVKKVADEVQENVVEVNVKPKAKSKAKPKPKEKVVDEMVFEVTEDNA